MATTLILVPPLIKIGTQQPALKPNANTGPRPASLRVIRKLPVGPGVLFPLRRMELFLDTPASLGERNARL